MKVVARLILVTTVLAAVGTMADEQPQPAPQGMSLRLELFVNDLEKSVDFYTRVLGFEPLKRSADYASVRSGSVVIGLGRVAGLSKQHYFNPEVSTARRGLGTEIVLEVDDVQSYYQKLKAAAYGKILGPPARRPWGATDFRIADPDGYYLRITSR